MFKQLLNFIFGVLKSVWGTVKKFFVKVCDFVRHVLDYFKKRKRTIRSPEELAVAIKMKFKKGEYNTVSCLDLGLEEGKTHIVNCHYNQKTCEVVDAQDMQYVCAEELDQETVERFNGKDLLVLS